jgi:hypothetical protein
MGQCNPRSLAFGASLRGRVAVAVIVALHCCVLAKLIMEFKSRFPLESCSLFNSALAFHPVAKVFVVRVRDAPGLFCRGCAQDVPGPHQYNRTTPPSPLFLYLFILRHLAIDCLGSAHSKGLDWRISVAFELRQPLRKRRKKGMLWRSMAS